MGLNPTVNKFNPAYLLVSVLRSVATLESNGLLSWLRVSPSHRNSVFTALLSLALCAGCSSARPPTDAAFAAPISVTETKGRYYARSSNQADMSENAAGESREPAVGDYVLGPGDSLTVYIQRVPEGNFDVTVRPDGFISLPVVDEVRVAGLTPVELDDRLTELFSSRFVDPELTVIVRSLRQPMVYVMGKVAAPGPVLYAEASSAAEAIARAGDVLPVGDVSNVSVIRLGDDGVIRTLALKTADNKDVFSYQAGPYMVLAATQLEPEDILFVPERGFVRLGADLQQIFAPVTAVGGAISTVLSPWLLWEILQDLVNNRSTGVGVNVP